LYVFCGSWLLVSYLRPADIDPAPHSRAVLKLPVKSQSFTMNSTVNNAQADTIHLTFICEVVQRLWLTPGQVFADFATPPEAG